MPIRLPSHERVFFWLTLAAILGVGLALTYLVETGFFHEVGMALIVSAILGFTVDGYLKSRIVKDVFEAAVGHILPPELREEMQWITTFRLLARRSLHRVQVELAANESVKVTTTVEREIENISSKNETIEAVADIDEWGFPGCTSSIVHCELSTYDGTTIRFTPPPENNGHYISARIKKHSIAPGERVRVFYKFVEYKRRNDLITYGLKHPTRDPEMDVTIDASLEHDVSFGHHGDVISLHSGRRILKGTFLPNHILSVRWWPRPIQTAASPDSANAPRGETQHLLLTTLQQAYKNPQASSFFLTSTLYVNAAARLNVQGDEIARLTLLLFALEIALKAFLLDNGTPEADVRGRKVRHSLKALHELATKAGLSLINGEIDVVIEDYHEYHLDHFFRYGDRYEVDLKDPQRASRAIPAVIGEIRDRLKRKL
jgi:phosphate/sulfate permease